MLRKRFSAWIMVIVLLLTTVPFSAYAAVSAENALITLLTYTGGTAGEDIPGDKTEGYTAVMGNMTLHASVNGTDARKLEWTKDPYTNGDESVVQPAMTAGNNNPWAVGAYLEIRVPTTGYTNLTFSAKLGGTKKGPADFKLQYSTDGVNFYDVGATYTITTNKDMQQAFDHVSLPTAAENCDLLYIRMTNTSDTLINGNTGLAGATGGETAVNNIVLTGNGEAQFFPQGDVDFDYTLTTADVRLMLHATVGLVSFDDEQALICDYNGDGALTSADVRAALLAIVGLGNIHYDPVANGFSTIPVAASENVITLLGTTAEVSGTGATVSGDTVTVSAAGTYRITGTMTNGRVIVAADETADNVTLILDNASITCSYTSPLFIQTADNVDIILKDGTVNTLTDGATYTDTTPNAALCAKCDMDISGGGTLTVHGNYNNGIGTNDDLKIKNGTIVVDAVNNALKGNDSIIINDGDITLTSDQDAMQADNTDAGKGYITINGGTINITAANDGIQAVSALSINGGTINAVTGGGSGTSPSSTDTASYKGIKGTASVNVTGGTITLDCKDDAVHSDGDVYLAGGTITASSGDDGIHSDGTLTIDDPTVLTVKKSYEAFEGVNMVVKGGTSQLTASDDGVNAAGGTDSNTGRWYVENNLLYVVSSSSAGYELKLTTDLTFDVNTQTKLLLDYSSTTTADVVFNVTSSGAGGSPSLANDWYPGLGYEASDVSSGYLPATASSKTAALDFKGYFDYNGVPNDGTATVDSILIKLGGQGQICLGALQLSDTDSLTYFDAQAVGSVLDAEAVSGNVYNLLCGTAHTASDTESSTSGGTSTFPGMGGGMGGGMTSETVGNLTMTGGYMAVYAGGDGIDVNGNSIMTGGTLIVHGPTNSGNAALDFDGTFDVNGGILVAAGSSGMLQTPSTSSTQYILSTKISSSKSGGTLFGIKDASGNTIVAFKPSKTYQAVIVSTPDITKGVTYTAYTGGSATGTVTDGLYDGVYTAGTSVGSKSVSSVVTSIGSSSGRW